MGERSVPVTWTSSEVCSANCGDGRGLVSAHLVVVDAVASVK